MNEKLYEMLRRLMIVVDYQGHPTQAGQLGAMSKLFEQQGIETIDELEAALLYEEEQRREADAGGMK